MAENRVAISAIVHFTVACLVAKPLNRSEAKGDFVMIQPCWFLNANYFVIMLTRYWSLLQQGHLQPHSKSKAWQLSTQLYNGRKVKPEKNPGFDGIQTVPPILHVVGGLYQLSWKTTAASKATYSNNIKPTRVVGFCNGTC